MSDRESIPHDEPARPPCSADAPTNQTPALVPAITALTFGAFLALLIFAAFPLGVLGLKIPLFRDFGLYSYPIAHYLREALRRGEIPLWNPLSFCGIPFLAQYNTMVLYPLSALYALLPLAQGLTWFSLLHVWLAGMGMFYLARNRTSSELAAALAGVTYAFNGITLDTGLWPCTIVPLAWAPWALWSVPRYVWSRADGTMHSQSTRRLLLAVLSSVLLFLSPFPEIIFMTLLFLGFLLLADLCPPGSFREGVEVTHRDDIDRRGELRAFLTRITLWGILTLGISAAQILPFLDLLLASHRAEDPTRFIWSLPPTGWANLLIPLYLCVPAHHGIYFQPEQSFVASYYMGIPTLAMAGLSAFRLRRRDMWVAFGLALFALVMAMGNATPLYDLVNRFVPPLRLMRFSIKYLFLLTLTLPLAAAGFAARLDSASTFERGQGAREVRLLGIIAAAFVAGVVVLLFLLRTNPAWKPLFPVSAVNAAHRVVFLLLFVAASAALSRANIRARQVLWHWVLISLLAGDLLTHKPVRTPWVEPWVVKPGILDEHWKFTHMPRHGISRIMFRPGDEKKFGQFVAGAPNEEYVGQRLALSFNCNLFDNIPKVIGFFPLKPAPIYRVQRLFEEKPDDLLGPLADFLSVSHVNASNRFYEWVPRETFLPMITTPRNIRFASPEQTLAALKSPEFDPRNEVYLPEEAAGILPPKVSGQAAVHDRYFSAHHNWVKIESPNDTLLVFNQTYYHHWHAYVDGTPVRIWPANHAFQAVLVPAGRHIVEWRYEDRVFQVGRVISLISLSALSGIVIKSRARSARLKTSHKINMQSPKL